MKYLKKILRFRMPDDIVDALERIPCKSEFVRQAIREKMIREGLLKEEKLPF